MVVVVSGCEVVVGWVWWWAMRWFVDCWVLVSMGFGILDFRCFGVLVIAGFWSQWILVSMYFDVWLLRKWKKRNKNINFLIFWAAKHVISIKIMKRKKKLKKFYFKKWFRIFFIVLFDMEFFKLKCWRDIFKILNNYFNGHINI